MPRRTSPTSLTSRFAPLLGAVLLYALAHLCAELDHHVDCQTDAECAALESWEVEHG